MRAGDGPMSLIPFKVVFVSDKEPQKILLYDNYIYAVFAFLSGLSTNENVSGWLRVNVAICLGLL